MRCFLDYGIYGYVLTWGHFNRKEKYGRHCNMNDIMDSNIEKYPWLFWFLYKKYSFPYNVLSGCIFINNV